MLLKTFIRSFRKNTFFSTLNILGLALGMGVFLLIAQYVHFETSYEDFNSNSSNIYRITLQSYLNGERFTNSAENYPAVGPALMALPEVKAYARLYNLGYKNNVVITNEEALPNPVAIKTRHILYADAAFLPMMNYSLLEGDLNTALAEPNTAVITDAYARLYFGNASAVGKMLHMQDDDRNNELVRVTGVVKEVPDNTHLKFDVLFSYKTLSARQTSPRESLVARFEQSWQRNDMYTYIQVEPGTDSKILEGKLPAIVEKNNPSLKENNQRDVLSLQPLQSIHLTSQLADEAEPNGDQRLVYFLGMIGLFVLTIALINYINLATAQAMERAKEVGVRKVMGAVQHQLIRQFLTEAACVNLAAMLIAYAIVGIALPGMNSISGLSLNVGYLLQPWFFALLFLLWIAGTLLSGFYPALVLASFKPLAIVKGKLKNSSSGNLLRKSLVVFQFTASVALIAGTLIVFKQLNFMMKGDIGMNIDQVLVVERPGIRQQGEQYGEAIQVFRHTLKENSAISFVSLSGTIPGKQREYKVTLKKYGASDDQQVITRLNSMDYEFMDVFKMKLLAGRNFSEQYVQDQDTSAVITESTAKMLGFATPEEAIGQTITIPDYTSFLVSGVVNDFHQLSLKSPLEPTIFYCDLYDGDYYSIRINTNDMAATINTVKAAWEKAFPGNPFEYFFLDDYFNEQYKNEQRFGLLFSTFAALAVVIGCLGLLGLSSYTATQRTKEIGIRKVLGATDTGIFTLLSREYMVLIGIATVIAIPLIYLVMNRWIQNFTYRIEIGILEFILAGGVVLFVALLTVSFQTLRAARSNPVNSLRYE